MWKKEKSFERVYGSYQVRSQCTGHDLVIVLCKYNRKATLQWKCAAPQQDQKAEQHFSPEFRVGGILWRLQVKFDVKNAKMGLYLKPVPTAPRCPVAFQLWLKRKDSSKSPLMRETERFITSRGMGWADMIKNTGEIDDFCVHLTIPLAINISFVSSVATIGPQDHVDLPSIDCFASLHGDAAMSDVVLKAGDIKIHAHKAILAAHSPSFKAMFQSGMKEQHTGQVCLEEVDGRVLEAFVSFMYGKLHQLADDMLEPLFILADAHQVQSLRDLCMDNMLISMSTQNVLDFAAIAELHCEQHLMDACMEFGRHNSAEVVQSTQMKQLMENNPTLAHNIIIGIVCPQKPLSQQIE